MSPVLQGGVTSQAPPSFKETVVGLDPEGWAALPPEKQDQVADKFFDTHYQKNPDFQALPEEQQNQIRVKFNKTNNVGRVSYDNPLQAGIQYTRLALNPLAHAVDASQMGAPLGITDIGQQADSQIPEFQNDPGLAGDYYRLTHNPVAQGVEGLAGAFHGAGNFINQAEQTGLGALAAGAANGNKVLAPWLGTAQKAAGALGGTAFNAINHGGAVLSGRETPQQALLALGLDSAALAAGGKTRIGNALAQGGAGGASSIGNDLIHGQPVDYNKAIQDALMQAGVGFAIHSPESQHGTHSGRYRQFPPGESAPRRFTVGNPDQIEAHRFDRALDGQITNIENQQSLAGEQRVIQNKLAALDKMYQRLSELIQNAQTPESVRQVAMRRQAKIKADYDALQTQKTQKFGKPPKAEKQHIDDSEQLGNLAALIQEYRKQGRGKEADVMMGKFSPETKAKVYDEVKRRETAEKHAANQQKQAEKQAERERKQAAREKAIVEKRQYEADYKKLVEEERAQQKETARKEAEARKIQDLKRRQEAQSQIALEKAQSAARQKEMARLKADIQKRSQEIAQAEAEEAALQKTKDEEFKKKIIADYKRMQDEQNEAVKRTKELEAQAEKTQDLKHKQAIQDRIALERDEGKQRAAELKRLKAEIQRRASEDAESERQGSLLTDAVRQGTAEGLKPEKEQGLQGQGPERDEDYNHYAGMAKRAEKGSGKTTSTNGKKLTKQTDMYSLVMNHKKSGKPIHTEYEAERTGETSNYRDKHLIPITDPVADSNGGVRFRAINENGQKHTYLFGNKKGDSRIVSMRPSPKEAEFHLNENGDVVRKSTGEIVPQQSAMGIKSSVLREKIATMEELMQRIQNKEAVSPQEILDTANHVKDPELSDVYGKMKPPEKREHWDKETGEHC